MFYCYILHQSCANVTHKSFFSYTNFEISFVTDLKFFFYLRWPYEETGEETTVTRTLYSYVQFQSTACRVQTTNLQQVHLPFQCKAHFKKSFFQK